MNIDEARALLKIQADFGGDYNRRAARELLDDVAETHGFAVADQLIHEFDLLKTFGFQPRNATDWVDLESKDSGAAPR